jgi:hypothetical protein
MIQNLEIVYSDLNPGKIKDNCIDKLEYDEDKKDVIYRLKIKRNGSDMKFNVNKLILISKNKPYQPNKKKTKCLEKPLYDVYLLGGNEIEGSVIFEVLKNFDNRRIEFKYVGEDTIPVYELRPLVDLLPKK